MKIFKVLIVALMAASVAWAQIPEENKPAVPCEHRGSFFSVGLGLSYMSLSKDEYISHRDEKGDWDKTLGRYVVKSVRYWGGSVHCKARCLLERVALDYLRSSATSVSRCGVPGNRSIGNTSLTR